MSDYQDRSFFDAVPIEGDDLLLDIDRVGISNVVECVCLIPKCPFDVVLAAQGQRIVREESLPRRICIPK
jgi:hypothetical protein